MPTPQIDRDAATLLNVLAEAPRDDYVDRNDVAKLSGLTPERINDAVALLVDSGYAEWIQTFGTAPYDFNAVSITSRGRYENQRLAAVPEARSTTDQAKPFRSVDRDSVREVTLPPSPIGSPYGFTDEDWEAVSERKHQSQVLYAVLGHQFTSEYFDTDALRRNIETMLRGAVDRYNGSRGKPPLTLDFTALSTGYGEHLFNEIARDIIGAGMSRLLLKFGGGSLTTTRLDDPRLA